MNAPWDIKGDDIDLLWASRIEAAAMLPELLRRLLFASGSVQQLEMRADGGVRLGGWDGIVMAHKPHPFCPPGLSVWELSVQEQVRQKLDADFEKRSRAPMPPVAQPQLATYVVVTARRFPGKQAWLAEKRKRGVWADVRVLDADDLSAWLSRTPLVSRWFAGKMGLPAGDLAHVQDVESFLSTWSHRTQPALPWDLVLVGSEREEAAELLRNWFVRGQPAPISVQSESKEESIVFAAAALASAPPGQRELFLARSIVVESRESWRWLTDMKHDVPPILLPLYEEFEPAEAAGKGLVVVPRDDGPQPWDSRQLPEGGLILEPIPRKPLAERLAQVGLLETEAMRLARESAGKLGALQRLCGYTELPGWTAGVDRNALFAMLLVGAWTPGYEADHETLRKLGSRPEDVEALCVELSQRSEQPIRRDTERWGRGVWRWASSADAWQALVRGLSDNVLKIFISVTLDVLGEMDPRYDLPKEQRWAAAAMNKTLRHSNALREGMAESIVRLALSDQQLRKVLGMPQGCRIAAGLIERLLTPEWRRWASLSPLLPTLAEAAPAEFLEAVRRSLDQGDAGVSRLLSEEEGVGYSPHAGLLWALETLSWNTELMPRVAAALARLAERDGGGRIVNRPIASLENLFQLLDERLEVFQNLMGQWPEVGWKLALTWLKKQRLGWPMFKIAQTPRYLKWDPPQAGRHPAGADPQQRVEGVVDLLIASAQTDAARWAALVDISIHIPDHLTLRVLKALDVVQQRINDPQASVWNRLRPLTRYTRARGGLDAEVRTLATSLYGALTPRDIVERVAWLFDSMDGLEEFEGEISDRRMEALREIWSQEGGLALLGRLALKGKRVAYTLGVTLGRSPLAGQFEAHLLQGMLPEDCTELVPYLVQVQLLEARRDIAWLKALIESLLEQRKQDFMCRILLGLSGKPIWQLVDELGEPVSTAYWSRVDELVGPYSPEEWEWAIDRLLAVRRPIAAAKTAFYARDAVSTATVLRILEAIRDTQTQEGTREEKRELEAYYVEHLFSRLDEGPSPDTEEIFLLELFFLPLLKDTKRSAPNLFRYLVNPNFFVMLLELIYPPEGELPQQDHELSEDDKERARHAYMLLEAWKQYPGHDLPDTEREERLRTWITAVLEQANAKRIGRVAQSHVGRVLARVPAAAEDGIWPCKTARELLRKPDMEALRHGLKIARFNMHGSRIKHWQEGGRQERELAERFHADAARLRVTWSDTASLLEELAKEYEQRAVGADAEVRSERLRHGWEPERPQRPAAPAPQQQSDAAVLPRLGVLQHLELRSIDVAELLSFELAPRLNLLAGDNSTGKTLVLDILWWCLTGAWSHQHKVRPTPEQLQKTRSAIVVGSDTSAKAASYFDIASETWSLPVEWPASESLVLYARVDGGFSARDPLKKRVLDFTQETLRDGLPKDDEGNVPCSGLVRDWVDWQKQQQGWFDVLRQALETLAGDDVPLRPGLPMRVFNDDVRLFPTLDMPYGRVPIIHASAAVKRVAGLAYLLVWMWHEHREQARLLRRQPSRRMVVLVDELESHLHPKWQRLILPALLAATQALSSELEVQVFVSTHSPLVMASVEPSFDDSIDRVFRFRFTEQGQVEAQEFPWSKQGDATNWLVSEMFDLKQARSKQAEEAIEAAEAYMRGEGKAPYDTQERIHQRLLEVLPGMDEFWPRWVGYKRGRP